MELCVQEQATGNEVVVEVGAGGIDQVLRAAGDAFGLDAGRIAIEHNGVELRGDGWQDGLVGGAVVTVVASGVERARALLRARGEPVDSHDPGEVLLHAVLKKCPEAIMELGAYVEGMMPKKCVEVLYMVCCHSSSVECLRAVLAIGLSANTLCYRLRPLQVVIEYGESAAELCRPLLEAGADANAVLERRSGRSLLMQARSDDVMQLLLSHGAKVNYAIPHNGWTALHYAASEGDDGRCRMLLAAGADPNAVCLEGRSVLMVARTAEVARQLLKYEADVRYVNPEDGRTALHEAVESRTDDVAEVFLEAGADPNAVCLEGRSVLMVARTAEVARLLLKYGADVHFVSPQGGRTALHEAAWGRRIDVCKELLAAGADANVQCSTHGFTALMKSPHLDVSEVLLRAGADPNACARSGRSVLMMAPSAGAARQLLSYGADVRYVNPQDGRTALHEAAAKQERLDSLRSSGSVGEACKVLLEAGADPSVHDKKKKTPADVAWCPAVAALVKPPAQ